MKNYSKTYSIENFKEIARIMKEKNINLREALKVFDIRKKENINPLLKEINKEDTNGLTF